MKRHKPHVNTERMDLIEEAADYYQMARVRGMIREQAGQPAKTEADTRLEATIAEVLTEEELTLVHTIAAGDVPAPYPYHSAEDAPHKLHEMAGYWDRPDDDVVDLEERRRKRDSEATR